MCNTESTANIYITINGVWGISGWSDSKESAWNAGDVASIPRPGRSFREGNG